MSEAPGPFPAASFPQPYCAVIFSSQRTAAGDREYAQAAEQMLQLARQQPGYLGMESVRDAAGRGITISYWTDSNAAQAWGQNLDHQGIQAQGRSQWYSQYALRVADVQRQRSFPSAADDTHYAGFGELASSRRGWIEQILKPWCVQATRQELLLAEHDWPNLAGKVDPQKTLWLWAWSRFEPLTHPDLGIDESHAVRVTQRDGRKLEGFPDARRSLQGQLCLVAADGPQEDQYVSIDEIATVERLV